MEQFITFRFNEAVQFFELLFVFILFLRRGFLIITMKSTKVQTLGGNIGTFGLETPCMHMY